MKQKIIIILKEKIFYFLMILFASVAGAVFAGIKMGENTLKTAELLRKLCIQDAIKIGFEIGTLMGTSPSHYAEEIFYVRNS